MTDYALLVNTLLSWQKGLRMPTSIMLPDDLVGEIDSLVGRKKRGRFVKEAIREKLERRALLNAIGETAGALSGEEYPEWGTPEKVADWVRDARREDMRRLKRAGRG